MNAPIRLSHRSVASVTGPDAEMFLNGLVTQSVSGFAPGEMRWGALLTPQGKVVADFLLSTASDGLLIDCSAVARDDLIQRLQRFRLRARVEITARDDFCIAGFTGLADPRSPAAPHRAIVPIATAPEAGDMGDYQTVRIAAGLAEAPFDFGPGEVFPADINMDLFAGVDFRKGCFVGQEVVSRMKRRGVSRRRTLVLRTQGRIESPAPLLAGGDEIGATTSAADGVALARLRIDRLAEATTAGVSLTAHGAPVEVIAPAWLAGELTALKVS